MKKLNVVFFIYFITSINCINGFGQNGVWEWAVQSYPLAPYTGVMSSYLSVDTLGNSYVAGNFAGNAIFQNDTLSPYYFESNKDAFFVKYDNQGNLIWIEKPNGIMDELGRGIDYLDENTAFCTGDFHPNSVMIGDDTLYSGNSYSMFVAKYEQNTPLWAKSATGGLIHSSGIATDKFSSVYVVGDFYDSIRFDLINTISSTRKGFIAKYDLNGQVVWTNTDLPPIKDIKISENNFIYVCGEYSDTFYMSTDTLQHFGNLDVFISKLHPDGQIVWTKTLGSSGSDRIKTLSINKDENIYFTGSFQDSIFIENDTLISDGGVDVYFACYKDNGDLLWSNKAIVPTVLSQPVIIAKPNGHSYALGVLTGQSIFGQDTLNPVTNGAFITKLDNSGSFLWTELVNGNFIGSAGIGVDISGSIYISGYFNSQINLGDISLSNDSSATNYTFYLAKFNENITSSDYNKTAENGINIYPNPTRGIITIKANNIKKIEILDSQGKQIYGCTGNFVDLSEQPNGIYFVKVITDKHTTIRKIIKQL